MTTKYFKVTLQVKGRMTQLPDSHQLFGALVGLVNEAHGERTTTEFVQQVQSGALNFTLSNVLPQNYLPAPSTYLENNISEKSAYKKVKKYQFLQKSDLDQLLANVPNVAEQSVYARLIETPQIHASIDSLRFDAPALSPNIYSIPDVDVVEVNAMTDETKQFTNFEFFFTINNEAMFVRCLEKAQAEGKILFLGPRHSQGLNWFQLINIKPVELSKNPSNTYLNLGRLLPNELNFVDSYLKLYTSERRPFQQQGDRNQRTVRKFVSFIDTGSIIQLAENQSVFKAGKSIASHFNPHQNSIIFGQSFLYPLSIKEDK